MMKFGYVFKEVLEVEIYLRYWVDKVVFYCQFKKIFGKVWEELINNGYDLDML